MSKAVSECKLAATEPKRSLMKVFVPITDDMLEAMDGSESPVPYQVGVRLEAGLIEAPVKELKITCPEDGLRADRPAQAAGLRRGRR